MGAPIEASSETAFHVANASVVETIRSTIQNLKAGLHEISSQIHARPETKWEEHFAHDSLSDYMEKQGWNVKRHICDLETAWSAEFVNGQDRDPITIGYNSEMDALPGIGHACGHNLIAISGVAAAIGTAAALKQYDIPGRVILLGTPAEEGGGGKAVMLEKKAYEGMSACLMLHPMGPSTKGVSGGAVPSLNAHMVMDCEYFGKPAHAAADPAGGVNALDAANIAYMSINAMRQQMDDDARVHGILGGEDTWVSNIIPAYSKVTYGIRHTCKGKRDDLVVRVKSIFAAAAAATGCSYKITESFAYDDLRNTKALAEAYKEIGEGIYGPENYGIQLGVHGHASTDFGNVTHALPACHPVFFLPNADPKQQPHTPSFAQAAGEAEAIDATLQAATVLSIVGYRVVNDVSFRKSLQQSWEASRGSD